MWYVIYNLLLLAASPAILIILLAKKRCRRGLLERVGLGGIFSNGPYGIDGLNGPNRPNELNVPNPLIWIHAVSLGEVMAIVPLVQGLRQRFASHHIVVTTVTETGREAVEQRLAGLATHAYAPLDFPWAVARSIQRLQPSLFVFVETELWPNLLRQLARRGVPTVLVNGRLSSRSFRRYHVLRVFFRQVLRHVRLFVVQSDRDAERFVAMGAVPDRVVRVGNLKFDQPAWQAPASVAGRPALGLSEHEQLIVAGSTHPGEEEQLLDAYRILQKEFPSLVLLLAPRHIERADTLEATVREKDLMVVRRSRLPGDSPCSGPRVIVLDTRGELASVYQHSVAAFVGGTLVPVGGHNLLEPAMWSKPVVFGIYTDHCAELADLLLQGGGAIRVQDGSALVCVIKDLLQDRVKRDAMGAAAQQVVLENRGAVQRTLDLLGAVLHEPARRPVLSARPAMPREPREQRGQRGIIR